MVLGPKHVGAFFNVLMCKFYKFYVCAVVGVIIEQLRCIHIHILSFIILYV